MLDVDSDTFGRAQVMQGAGEDGVGADELHVGGFVPFTTTDYPGALAAVVFCQGCPWRCGYCHNPHLLPARSRDEIAWPIVLGRLALRRGLLDAVVFSGGEPTAQAALSDAMRAVRNLGFAVGLHTGGAYPRRLEQVLPLVDWVGFDIKSAAGTYAVVTRVRGSGHAARVSLDLLQGAGVPFEIRTTVHCALTPRESLRQVAHELGERGITRWLLQPFRQTGCTSAALSAVVSPDAHIDAALLAQLRCFVPDAVVRN